MRRWSGSEYSSSGASVPQTVWIDDERSRSAELGYHTDHPEIVRASGEQGLYPDLAEEKGKGKQEPLLTEAALQEFDSLGDADRGYALGEYQSATPIKRVADVRDLFNKRFQVVNASQECNPPTGEPSVVAETSPPLLWPHHRHRRPTDLILELPRNLLEYDAPIVKSGRNMHCVVCGESALENGVTLHCGHRYGDNCLKDMFSSNVDDENCFPPRCCGKVVPMSLIEKDLSGDVAELYRARIFEYETPVRLYCSNKLCAKFLGPRKQHPTPALCSSCNAETCELCTAPAHAESVRCKVDKGLRKALILGQSCGWQRCPRCRQLVERNSGCYHMSCRCGAQFCYLCAAEWKTCGCTGGTSRFLRLIGARKLRIRGNYLVKSELLGMHDDGVLTKLCKKSWRGVVGMVHPRSKVSV